MSEDKKTALLPKRRLSEFQDAEPWSIMVIKDFAKIITGNKDTQDKVDGGAYPFFVRSQKIERINSYSYDGEAILTSGDGVGVGKNYHYIDGKFDFHQREYCVCAFSENVCGKFFFYYFAEHFYNRVMQLSAKNSVDSVRMAMISEMPIPLPCISEQEKIADCLTSVDDLITAEAEKLAALKDHKKGLMQQLFPREGETTPRLRFPEFQDADDWEEKPFGKLISTVTPPRKLQTSAYASSGRFPIVDQSQEYICGWTDDEDAIIHEGLPYIVFGDHTCAVKFIDKPFAQGADGIKILDTVGDISKEFLFQSLQAFPLGMKGYRRHFSILKEKIVTYPKLKTGEQQKITDFLTTIDDLIAAQTKKLKALKDHKKGLMQQLFPASDEVNR